MDLKLTNATLPGREGQWDIAIEKDRIVAIAPELPEDAEIVLHAEGHLVIPGFVDGHMHLDKALLLDRYPAVEGTFAEAMRETLRAKQGFTIEDIQSRARRALERSISFGTTAMRSHVEVDPVIGLTALEALLPLRQQYRWGITLQLAIFAQEGITNVPGEITLLRQAMAMGGDVIGSAPYVDPNPVENIRIVFDLAQEFDVPVDLHLDFLDDDSSLLVHQVIVETLRRGWQGRVCLGHMTKLAALPPRDLEAIAIELKTAGISILALPVSDLYMMARKDTHNVRRGVAPIHFLAKQGVTAGVAVNNVQNLFTPFGDGDMLKVCALLAQVLHLGTADNQTLCLEMATTLAARAIGLKDYGLEAGKIANLVMLDARSVPEAIAAVPSGRTVIKQGQIVAQSRLEQHLYCVSS